MYGVIRINGFHLSLTLMRVKMFTILDDNFFTVIVLMGWVLSLSVSTDITSPVRDLLYIPYYILDVILEE